VLRLADTTRPSRGALRTSPPAEIWSAPTRRRSSAPRAAYISSPRSGQSRRRCASRHAGMSCRHRACRPAHPRSRCRLLPTHGWRSSPLGSAAAPAADAALPSASFPFLKSARPAPCSFSGTPPTDAPELQAPAIPWPPSSTSGCVGPLPWHHYSST
jgi:hypothetical protein